MFKIQIKLERPTLRRASGRGRLIGAGAAALAFPVLALAAPVAPPNQFADGDVISANDFNENFDAFATSINDNDARVTALENAPPNPITIRKVTATGPVSIAIAFCQNDEVLTGGGCFLPPENRYDPAFGDYDTYYTGNYPRPMVGLQSLPVAAGTAPADIRPTAVNGGSTIPFPADIIAADEGSIAAENGGGWACRPGIVDIAAGGGANAVTSNLYESWFYPVKAYAICMAVP